MAHGLKVALILLVALVVATAIMVLGIVFTIQKLNRGFTTGGYLVQRAKLLERTDEGELAADVVAQIEDLTSRMLAEAAADHMRSAIQRELESVQMAKLAVQRGDVAGARRFLERVGRRMVRFEF